MSKRPDKLVVRGCSHGRIVAWPADEDPPEVVAARASNVGDTTHKKYHSRFGPANWKPKRDPKTDKTPCGFYEDWQVHLLQDALRQAIISQCTGEFQLGSPRRVWAYVNDVLHEAKITVPGQAVYHGFPILDPVQYPGPERELRQRALHVTIP
jgi:hypothetical protein